MGIVYLCPRVIWHLQELPDTKRPKTHIFIAVQDMLKVSYDANHMIEWEKLRTGGCTRMRTIIIETGDMSFKRSHCLILTSR